MQNKASRLKSGRNREAYDQIISPSDNMRSKMFYMQSESPLPRPSGSRPFVVAQAPFLNKMRP